MLLRWPLLMAEPGDEVPPGGGADPESRPRQETTPPEQLTPEELRALRQELQELRGVRDLVPGLQQELQQMRTQWGQVEQVFNPQSRQQDPNTEYYLNPGAAMQRTAQQLEDRILTRVETQQTQRDWWNSFYRDHQDLDSPEGRDIVRLAIMRNTTLAQSGFTAEAAVLLGTEARTLALGLGQRFGGGSGGGQPPIRLVEGGGQTRRGTGSQGSTTQPNEPDEPLRIGEVIRAQRANRRRRAGGE